MVQNQTYVEYKQLDLRIENGLTEFKLVNISEFLEIVKELKCNKSSGVKDLNTRAISDAMNIILEVFVKICNKSLVDGLFPTVCTTARLAIIPKKGDVRILDNLRPISILSILGKVIEKFIKN